MADQLVTIQIKKVGSAKPLRLQVPSPVKVSDLRKLVGSEINVSVDRLKLFSHGSVLHDTKRNSESFANFSDGDSLLAVVVPKKPAMYLQDHDLDDEDDLRFHLSESTPQWLQCSVSFLQERLKVPDIILVLIFSVSLKKWVMIFLWFIMAPVAYRWDLGPVYILMTFFCLIFFNLGKRQQGDASAYSIFNENFRELPGTLNAERLDQDIRAGQF